jgi:hypothetical protein
VACKVEAVRHAWLRWHSPTGQSPGLVHDSLRSLIVHATYLGLSLPRLPIDRDLGRAWVTQFGRSRAAAIIAISVHGA